jgi:hypothetical protein
MWKIARPSLALVALLASASPALADTTFSNASEMVRPKAFDLHDYFTMDMTVYYNGASVTGLGSPYQPTPDGYDDITNPNFFMTRFRPQYKITPDLTIGPVIEWNYIPVLGGDYNFGNIFIRVMDAKVIETKDLHVMGDLRFYFPNTAASQAQDMILAARAYHDGYYTFRGTHLSLGAEEYLRGWAYGSAAQTGQKMVEYWWAPYLNYDITPTFGVKFQIDGNFYSQTGDSDIHNDPTHLRMGVGWSPIPELFLAPHLYVPITSPGFSWSAAAFNLEAWAKLF